MFEMKKAIIVSNILDPLSRNVEDLKEVYPRLFESGRYDAIENRPVRGEELIPFFNEIRPAEVTTT